MYSFVTILLATLMTLRAEAPEQAPAFQEPEKGPEQGTIYSPIGKRDPFNRLQTDEDSRETNRTANALEKYSVEQFQLRAVLRGLGQTKAMFEDPEGNSHILGEGDLIGRERATISRIINSEVIITQRTFNYLGAE